MTKRLFRLKTDDTNLINWLKSKPEFQQFAIDIFNKVRTGELVPRAEQEEALDLEKQYKELRNKKLTKQCLNLEIKNRLLLVHDLHYSPDDAVKIAKGERDLDDFKGVRCAECSWKSDESRSNQNQVDSLIYHLKDEHGRTPTEDEQVELLEIVAQ